MLYVKHGDRFCVWFTSDPGDQVPVVADWWGPPEETGWPHVGECRSLRQIPASLPEFVVVRAALIRTLDRLPSGG
jgi:hypothetical protein